MGTLRFIVLLLVAGALAALDAAAVHAGLPQPLAVVLLLVVLGVAVALIMRTPAWGSSVRHDRERAARTERF